MAIQAHPDRPALSACSSAEWTHPPLQKAIESVWEAVEREGEEGQVVDWVRARSIRCLLGLRWPGDWSVAALPSLEWKWNVGHAFLICIARKSSERLLWCCELSGILGIFFSFSTLNCQKKAFVETEENYFLIFCNVVFMCLTEIELGLEQIRWLKLLSCIFQGRRYKTGEWWYYLTRYLPSLHHFTIAYPEEPVPCWQLARNLRGTRACPGQCSVESAA